MYLIKLLGNQLLLQSALHRTVSRRGRREFDERKLYESHVKTLEYTRV